MMSQLGNDFSPGIIANNLLPKSKDITNFIEVGNNVIKYKKKTHKKVFVLGHHLLYLLYPNKKRKTAPKYIFQQQEKTGQQYYDYYCCYCCIVVGYYC